MTSLLRKVIIGNWKMNKTYEEALTFVKGFFEKSLVDTGRWVGLAVPYTLIAPLAKEVQEKGSFLKIGAQNMNDGSRGSFTGEIAAFMLKEAGSQFVLLGHSERRHLFGEDDAFIHRKLVRAFSDNLFPVLCVGETEKERLDDLTYTVIERQLSLALKEIPSSEIKDFMVAYEPVWAIGTGLAATPEIAQEAHHMCRRVLSEILGEEKALKIPLLYGGSVTPSNAPLLLEQEAINGLLIGGASLSLESFLQIVNDSGSNQ